MTPEQLAIIKSELTNDPTSLGLTTSPADDEANAVKLNEVRESIQIDRDSIAASLIEFDVGEYAATSSSQRDWLRQVTASGDVRPSVIRDGFYEIFASGTETRQSFDSVAKRDGSRAEQLLGANVVLTPSDVANARAS